MRSPRISYVLASSLLLNGCAPALLQDRTPSNINQPGTTLQASGLRYWMPADVAMVHAVVTTSVTTEIVVGEKNGKAALFPEVTREVERAGTLAVRSMADPTAAPYTLDVAGGRLRDTSIGIEVSSAGILRSVSPSSTGRAGEVVQAVSKFAGTALSMVSGLPFLGLTLDPNKHIGLSKTGPLTLALECDPFESPVSTMPLRVRAFVSESEEGCGLLLEILQREAALKQHEDQRLGLELQLDTTDDANLPKLKGRIQAVKVAIKSTQNELSARQARFAALLDAFVADKRLGVVTEVAEFATVLQLDELPPAPSELARFSKAKAFFEQTGLLISMVALGAPPRTPASFVPVKGKNTVRIHYRQSEPRRVRVEATTEVKPALAQLKLLSEFLVDVILPGAAIQYVDFESSAWAQRNLALTFDDRGRPVRLERSGTSAGAAIAVAVSHATRTVRDEYATGLAKIADIQATQQKLETGAVNSQIEALKKKKELLDARLAVEGSASNFQTMLEQQQLQADIALLQARQTQSTALGTASQQLEIETLKLQLEQLKVQVDILKAQQEFERLNKK